MWLGGQITTHQALDYKTPAEVYFKEHVAKETNTIQGVLKSAP